MPEIRFSPAVQPIPDYVLNHPTESPLHKYNIRFHIEGNYLNDYTDKGIKKFIDKHYNDKTGFLGIGGKDLEFKEVKNFIIQCANNAPKLQGATFDLLDPKLGLTNRDDVNAPHLKSRFVLETQKGELPSQSVVFFETSKARFDLKEAEKKEKHAENMVKEAEEGLKKAKSKLESAQWEYNQMVNFLGKESVKELEEKTNKLNQITKEIETLRQQRNSIQEELRLIENDPSKQEQARRLKLTLIGINYEIREKEKEGDKTLNDINRKRGPLGFMGVGESLEGLQKDINRLQKAEAEVKAAEQRLNEAKELLKIAREERIRIQNGEDFPAGPQPVQPQPIQSPQPSNSPPSNYVSVPGSSGMPGLHIENGTNIPQPQPPQQPISQPQVNTPNYSYIPVNGKPTNPTLHIEAGSSFPTIPDGPLYTPPSPVGLNPYDKEVKPTSNIGIILNNTVSFRWYTVKSGDTLRSIAKNELKDENKWTVIRDLNTDLLGPNYMLKIGQNIRLPIIPVNKPTS